MAGRADPCVGVRGGADEAARGDPCWSGRADPGAGPAAKRTRSRAAQMMKPRPMDAAAGGEASDSPTRSPFEECGTGVSGWTLRGVPGPPVLRHR